MASDIEGQLQQLGRAELPSSTIGEMVVQRLKGLDRVAYIRFASVYKDFADLETFKEEVDAMLTPPGGGGQPNAGEPANALPPG